MKVRYVEKIFERADCPVPLIGEDIKRYLRDCTRVKVSAATLGEEFDRELRRLQIGNMSAAVEFDARAAKLLDETGDGYSPGYGDFPLSVNRDIINVLNASVRIGLCVTSAFILTPQKSVTRVTRII
jgi:cobalamin-dependent methionine synthase I